MGLPLGLLLVLQQPIIVDGHIDTPQRMLDMRTDISVRLADGHVDVPRMKEGGLTAAFFSIWVDARYRPGTAFRRALDLIGAVRGLVDTNPEVELATDAEQVRAAAARGHVAALLGVEGGLTDFGRQVVRRMNELGMLVDVSHVSDATFRDVLATRRAR